MVLKIICTTCNGEGTVPKFIGKKTCPECDGDGRIITYSTNMLAKIAEEEI